MVCMHVDRSLSDWAFELVGVEKITACNGTNLGIVTPLSFEIIDVDLTSLIQCCVLAFHHVRVVACMYVLMVVAIRPIDSCS